MVLVLLLGLATPSLSEGDSRNLLDALDQLLDEHPWRQPEPPPGLNRPPTDLSKFQVPERYQRLSEPPSLEELIEDARSGSGRALKELGERDSSIALEVAKGLISTSSRLTALEFLLNEQPENEEWRELTVETALDPHSQSHDSTYAAALLIQTDWDGRGRFLERFLSGSAALSPFSLGPLVEFIEEDEERWIPVLESQLRSTSAGSRYRAAMVLVEIGTIDALTPLIPMLEDEEWADRWRLLNALEAETLPEGRTALRHLLETTGKSRDALAAAKVLSKWGDKSHGEILRDAVFRTHGEHAVELADLAIDLQVFTAPEMRQALEILVDELSHLDAKERRRALFWFEDDSSTGTVALGKALVNPYGSSKSRLDLVFRTASDWVSEDDPHLSVLEGLMLRMRTEEFDSYFLDRLEAGESSSEVLQLLLDQRERFVKKFEDRLRRISLEEGASAGVATVILGKRDEMARVVKAGSEQKALGVIVASRYLAYPLDVSVLMERAKSPPLKKAVVAFLDSRTEQTSRALSHQLDPRFRIVGYRMSDQYDFIVEEENRIVREYQESGNQAEVYALFSLSGGLTQFPDTLEIWKSQSGQVELRDSHGLLGYSSRALKAVEFEKFEHFLAEREVEEWPALNQVISDAPIFQYLHLTPAGGVRVGACLRSTDLWVELQRAQELPYRELYNLFVELLQQPLTMNYRVLESHPDGRVVISKAGAREIWSGPEGLLLSTRDSSGKLVWRRLALEEDRLGEEVQVPTWTGDFSQIEKFLRARPEYSPPIGSRSERPFQPAGQGKWWVAVPEEKGTTVGVFTENTSSFVKRAYYPNLIFESAEMWVVTDKILVANDDLLELPLRMPDIDDYDLTTEEVR